MTKQIQNVLSWLALGFLIFSFGSCLLIREIGTVEDSVVVVIPAGIVLIVLALPFRFNQLDIYPPYQILTLRFPKNQMPLLESSNIYYQRILDLSDENVQNKRILKDWADYYNLPYRIKPKPEHVLVVGSGTGNDVAAAVRNGAGKIDAVETDPVILQFGKQLHPESPYQAHNVNTVVNDARAFIRYANKKYDLIVYGLLDSHSLLSSRSGGIRLDSYMFTLSKVFGKHGRN